VFWDVVRGRSIVALGICILFKSKARYEPDIICLVARSARISTEATSEMRIIQRSNVDRP
jgi:hypothetical protein